MTYTTKYKSPIGELTIASDGKSITGLWTEGQKYFAKTLDANSTSNDKLDAFVKTRTWLDDYFVGNNPDVEKLPLAPLGSEFRQKVWEILLAIPYGELITYGDIAKKLAKDSGKAASAQAVGGAVGHNPISVIIPCHRVVGSGGSLTGYAGGIDKKIWLLELEKANMDGLFVPKKGTAL